MTKSCNTRWGIIYGVGPDKWLLSLIEYNPVPLDGCFQLTGSVLDPHPSCFALNRLRINKRSTGSLYTPPAGIYCQ